MQPGTYISGAGHGLMIAWVLFGGFFDRFDESELPQDMNVSIISEADLAALSAPQPSEAETPAAPTPPSEENAPDNPTEETGVETPKPPDAQDAPTADPTPDVSDFTPLPSAIVAPEAPDALETPGSEASAQLIVETPAPPVPRPAPRVAPTPAAAPPPDAEVSDTVREEVTRNPEAATETQAEEAPATAPEEAATQIVTEAEEPSAPKTSVRPMSRPSRPSPAATETAEAPRESSTDSAVQAALQNAADATPVPTGPPLTGGEKDALRVAVQRCWNVGSLSSEALNTTVVLSVTMNRNGRPESGSIRMLSSEGGSASAARQAFEAARRAVIRCGATGYNLPTEKFARWQEIEMTFNPERMRIK